MPRASSGEFPGSIPDGSVTGLSSRTHVQPLPLVSGSHVSVRVCDSRPREEDMKKFSPAVPDRSLCCSGAILGG